MISAPRFIWFKSLSILFLLPLVWPSGVSAVETLRYAGATTLQRDFMPEAAARFTTDSGIHITITGGNTDPGLKALQAGSIDLAGAGRPLLPAERAAGLRQTQIGWDPLVVVVHRNNPVSDLTLEQLQGIFAGTTGNWKELGGRDEPIILVNGPQGSGMSVAVQELILAGRPPSSLAIISPVVSDEDQLVARMPAAICAISRSMVDQAEVKLLKVAGSAPGDVTSSGDGYPLLKPLFLVFRDKPSPAVRRFVEFALAPEGQKLMAKKFLPLAPR